MVEEKHDAAKKILQDAAEITARCLFVSPQLKFYKALLLGHVNRQLFYDKVLDF